MTLRKDVVTMMGNPLTLSGNPVKLGEKAPDFEVMDNDLKPVKFSSFKGKLALILSVPSLDTSVCSKETRRFNEEVAKYGNQVTALSISMDLPFAQKRWCGSEGIASLQTLSDYKSADFGNQYGVLIQELRLLARAIFIVDQAGFIQYVHLVKEITQEPPYEEVMKKLKSLLSGVK
jgi:thiol peroxidase